MKRLIKKYRKNLIIVFALGFILYFYILFKTDLNEVINKIAKVNIKYLIVILVLLFIYVFFEGIIIYIITKRKVKGVTLIDAFRLNMVTQFFNNITPFATGGQPFQIIYFNARGVKPRDATGIVLLNFLTYNIAYIILGIICFIYKYEFFANFLRPDNYHYLLFIGFGVNLFVTALAFFLTFSRKFYHLFIDVIWVKIIRLPILRRFKLEQKIEKTKQSIEIFHDELKILKKDKRLWFETILLHIIRLSGYYTIPLFTFLALGENVTNNEINIITGAIFVALVVSYIPTPGASGGAEGLFYLFFAFLDFSLIPALLLWRFLTYYLYMFFGFITLITLKYKKNLEKLDYEIDLYTKENG